MSSYAAWDLSTSLIAAYLTCFMNHLISKVIFAEKIFWRFRLSSDDLKMDVKELFVSVWSGGYGKEVRFCAYGNELRFPQKTTNV